LPDSCRSRRGRVVERLDSAHAGCGRRISKVSYAVFWEHIKYSNGAYGSNPGNRLARLNEPDRRIYLGCPATSTNPSWMEGAFRAAWFVVDKLHQRVMA
jgi:monoamine oxidase